MDGVRSAPGSAKAWAEAPVSASSVLHYKRALRGILAGCKLPSNPLKAVPASAWPRDRSKPTDVFQPEELAQVLMMIRQSGTATAEADHDVLAFLALTGLRRGELARLRVADVDIQRRTMAIDGKTDRAVVRMSADAVDVVRRLIDRVSGDMLIPGGENAVARVCRRWRTRLQDKRLHAHALRHSFATALLRAGHDIRTVQRHTRHASLVMLQRYLHATADDEAVPGSIDLGLGERVDPKHNDRARASSFLISMLTGAGCALCEDLGIIIVGWWDDDIQFYPIMKWKPSPGSSRPERESDEQFDDLAKTLESDPSAGVLASPPVR